jgi:Zn-dependent M28 family amino/carboxypeptidase
VLNSGLRALLLVGLLLTIPVTRVTGAESADSVMRRLLRTGLSSTYAHTLLKQLTVEAGHRLSGSPGSQKAITLTQRMMRECGLTSVRVESVMVPCWVRGPVEEAILVDTRGRRLDRLNVCALGGSIATSKEGITGEIVEVRSFEELRALGETPRGKIVLFNRPMDPSLLNMGGAYGGAVDQRSIGAIVAARSGAVAALVRSVTLALDAVPHTGATRYTDTIPKIPIAAVSTMDAEKLHTMIARGGKPRLRLRLSCATLPDVSSANVIGELVGSEKPEEVVVVGGHLDSWDKGTGAHDDGAGCVQAIEALRLLREIGVKPKRTIRAVLFMNEENGSRGGRAYAEAPERRNEHHIAAIESDGGGFTPRGFGVQGDSTLLRRVLRWQPLFDAMGAGTIRSGHGGVDVSPIIDRGAAGFGLIVDQHRYFDYHHSANDTFDKVHPRELEMGAIVEAFLCHLIAEEGF